MGIRGVSVKGIASRLWSAKQIRSKVVLRFWYVKQVWLGEPELRLIHGLSDPKRLTLDVGSNRGVYAVAALRFSKRVIAFEPQPHFATFLRRFLPRTVDVVECAASDTDGSAILFVPSDPRSHPEARLSSCGVTAGTQITVSTHRLDQLIAEDVGLIKIDVEGHELAVLNGASNMINACRPNLIVEVEDRHRVGAVVQTFQWFEARSYQGYYLANGALSPVDQLSNQQGDAYVYNFVFLPKERAPMIRPSLWAALSGVLAF
jgi:FkbM family methyltransferase